MGTQLHFLAEERTECWELGAEVRERKARNDIRNSSLRAGRILMLSVETGTQAAWGRSRGWGQTGPV